MKGAHLPPALASGLQQSQIPMIDGLRAVAVFLVIFYHLGYMSVPGGLGVLVFFVISGFLITWLLLKENHKRGTVSWQHFYARRSLRIFPALYAYCALCFLILLVRHKPIYWPQATAALLYYNNYYQALFGDPGNAFSHTWSLGVEEQFYLIWPSVFLLLKKDMTRLARAAAWMILAVWVWRAILQFVLDVHQGYFYEAFDTRFDHLLIGCLLAILLFHSWGHSFWKYVCGPWQLGIAAVLLAVSVSVELLYGSPYRDSAGFIFHPLLTALMIPQLIATRSLGMLRWFQSSVMKYLGRISYSLYLYQQIVIDPVKKVLAGTPMLLQVTVVLITVISMASLSYHFIEKPFLRLKDRWFHS